MASNRNSLEAYAKADWNDVVPRLLAYTQFLLSRAESGVGIQLSSAHGYVTEAVELVLEGRLDTPRQVNESVFTALAAAIAMLIRRDGQHFPAQPAPSQAGSPVIQLASPTDLVLYLSSRPEVLREIPARRFEEIVAELLADFGYTVELTKSTRDDGIDIIAMGRLTPLGIEEKYLVQCKRYARDNHVGVGVVRELLGVGVRWPNTGVMIATSSTFSQPARALALHETTRWRMHLRDYDDITRWIHGYAGKRGRSRSGTA